MAINDEKLKKALLQGVISEETYNKLVEFDIKDISQLETENIVTSKNLKNNFETILLYAVSFVLFIGMYLFMEDVIGKTNSEIILLTSIIYLVIFWFSGEFLWKKIIKKLRVFFTYFQYYLLALV